MNAFRVGDALIDIAAPAHLREEIAGDLRERFHRMQTTSGKSAAQRSYWKDLAGSLFPLVTLKTVTELQAQWQSSMAMGMGAAIASYLFIWVALALHFNSPLMDFLTLSGIVLVFILAFKRARVGAVVVFMFGLFVVEITDLALTPSARHFLFGSMIYIAYLKMVAVLAAATLAGLSIRGIFKRSHS